MIILFFYCSKCGRESGCFQETHCEIWFVNVPSDIYFSNWKLIFDIYIEHSGYIKFRDWECPHAPCFMFCFPLWLQNCCWRKNMEASRLPKWEILELILHLNAVLSLYLHSCHVSLQVMFRFPPRWHQKNSDISGGMASVALKSCTIICVGRQKKHSHNHVFLLVRLGMRLPCITF